MLKENLVLLRGLHGLSQEAVAEKIGISRQAYAKWENGNTIPDIEKCALLAELYGVSIDSLIKTQRAEGIGVIAPAPKGKYIWGTVLMNDRGQIVIPKDAREKFALTDGTRLVVLSDEEGIVLLPAKTFEAKMKRMMELASRQESEE